MRRAAFLPVAAVAACLFGCASAVEMTAKIGAMAGESTGVLTGTQAQALRNSAAPLAKSFEDITPEQEYYIGRAVGAQIAAKYPVWKNEAANHYLNVLGTALSLASERPETFGGYHFQILESEEINAFAAPGGFIFVTRGLLKICRAESEAAAVLAHEIAHVELQHGLKAIKQSRLTSALAILAVEGAKSVGSQQLSELTAAFEGSIEDITRTLVETGYSRSQEYDADRVAKRILSDVGYGPSGLVSVLKDLENKLPPGGPGFASTHPSPADRVAELSVEPDAGLPNAAQAVRFRLSLSGI
jgi:predicted Zn-dependent protease